MRLVSRLTALLALVLIAGCTHLPPGEPTALPSAGGPHCVGVAPPPPGLVEVDDAPLLQAARGAPGLGGLCIGKVFLVERPVAVYRVWDGARRHTALGRWWSFSPPQGSRDDYRRANVICPAWSALDRLSACTLKPGARIVVGPGQSAECADGPYPASAVNQVYVPNDVRQGQVFVDDCSAEALWPGTPPVEAAAR